MIAAISTPIGTSGIGIVRMSGESSLGVLAKVFVCKQFQEKKISHHMYHGYIIDENKNIVDEVLVSIMLSPKSYTCEDVVEINCHGGLVCVREILNLVLKNGARLAEPGEFTKRAYLNGRIDLVQAQAVIDIINSKTELSKKIAMGQLKGSISKKIEACKQKIMDIMAQLEASIDFPEEYGAENVEAAINEATEGLKKLLDSAAIGEVIRNGIDIAIIGKPNVGKSSLLNLLAQKELAIVTEIPGTTRDIVHEYINIGGVPAKILDTAGIHRTEDKVEGIGIEKAKGCVGEADVVLVLFDWSREFDRDDEDIINFVQEQGRKSLFIANKVDRERKFFADEDIFGGKDLITLSVKEGTGVENLFKEIKKVMFGDNEKILETADEDFISDVRQKTSLEKSLASLSAALKTVEEGLPYDLATIDLADAYEYLSQITGNFADESVGDKIADEIFSKFCVGK